MRSIVSAIFHLFQLKKIIRFFSFSAIATVVDFCLFTFILSKVLVPFFADLTSSFTGMCVNFIFQKRYVFDQKRKTSLAFLLSVGSSIIIMFAGSFLMKQLAQIEELAENLFIAKLIVMGTKGILNYTSKKWVFEKTLR